MNLTHCIMCRRELNPQKNKWLHCYDQNHHFSMSFEGINEQYDYYTIINSKDDWIVRCFMENGSYSSGFHLTAGKKIIISSDPVPLEQLSISKIESLIFYA